MNFCRSWIVVGCCVALLTRSMRADERLARIEVEPLEIRLGSARAAAQLLVTAISSDGQRRDATRQAQLTASTPEIVRIVGTRVQGLRDGTTTLTVAMEGQTVDIPVTVEGTALPDPIRFEAEVLAVLTKQGCNAGSCHGAPEGKGGFALSMLAYLPQRDEESLIRGARSRRVTPLEPEESLLLKKPMLRVTHVGGKKLRPSDVAYQMLRDWIAEGARRDPPGTPRCLSIAVATGGNRVLRLPGGQQQLRVRATFSDGAERDVTPIATFMSSNPAIATVDASGLVVAQQRGQAAVTVRYLNHVESVYLTVEQSREGYVWNDAPEFNAIDRFVHAKLRQLQFLPGNLCDDATFLRRVHLDLTGLLPTVDEARAFLNDPSADRRARRIDQLLDSEEFARYWASKWADLMRVSRGAMKDGRAELFSMWLVDSYRRNQSFREFAAELLTAVGDTREVGPTNFFAALPKSEDLAETSAQLFIGSRINCAKCHNHPFENWTQDDYYRIAAVFARVQHTGTEIGLAPSGEAMHPATGAAMKPWGLESVASEIAQQDDRRMIFATWLTNPANPYFARVEANRIWAHLLGRGIVHPIDDFRSSNPPSNPELLDWLAGQLQQSAYDRKQLIRTICRSATYQRSAATDSWNEDDLTLFSHYPVRRLTAEQLQDAIGYATRAVRPASELAAEVKAGEKELTTLITRADSERPAWEAQLLAQFRGKDCWLSVWQHTGPFADANYDRAVKTSFLNEAALDLSTPLPNRQRWEAHPEWVDGQAHEFPRKTPGAHYVARKLYCEKPTKAVFSLGSDDGLRVWLNGQLVLDKPQKRGIKPDDDRLEVDLIAGMNTLLLKVIDAGGYTGFYFRIVSVDGLTPEPIEMAADLAEVVLVPAVDRSAAQQRLVIERQLAATPRVAQLRDELRRYAERSEYQTQRLVPEPNDFLQAFGQPKRETACACERLNEPTIDQSLQVLNGELVWRQTSEGGQRLAGLTDGPLIDELYLGALSRQPNEVERTKALAFLRGKADRTAAVQDLLWVVINLQEFLFQH